VARDSPPLLVIVNKALKSIFHDPQDIYIRTKVRDFLFDGITINCNVQDFAATAVCTQIKAQVPGLVEVQKNVFKFSILGPVCRFLNIFFYFIPSLLKQIINNPYLFYFLHSIQHLFYMFFLFCSCWNVFFISGVNPLHKLFFLRILNSLLQFMFLLFIFIYF
jgi:hypothetical protein